MYGIWIYIAFTLVFVRSMYGDTGSGIQTSCPVKCDLVQEIQILRQLLNQESILRIDMNSQLQKLRKEMTENRKNTQSTNATLQETMIAMATLEEATNIKLTKVNRGTSQTLTKLEHDMVSLNQTYQGKYKAHTHFYIDCIEELKFISEPMFSCF